MSKVWRGGRALVAVVLAAAGTLSSASGAGATDVATLREQAQSVADEVTSLEHGLQGLRVRREHLEGEIDTLSLGINKLESHLHAVTLAYESAAARYAARAIEAYKNGVAGQRLEMLLSTRSLGDMLDVAEASSIAAELDANRLQDLLQARADAEEAQASLDNRKQQLLAIRTEVATVAGQMKATVRRRRATLADLNAQIKRLEQEMGVAAAPSTGGTTASLDGSGPTAGIPVGFTSTGVSFEGVASWYGPGFEGNPTASGDIFDPRKFTAASLDLPLGTWLYVEHEGRGVVVLVNDRGPYIDDRVLDLSQAAAETIGITGLGWVRATVIVKR